MITFNKGDFFNNGELMFENDGSTEMYYHLYKSVSNFISDNEVIMTDSFYLEELLSLYKLYIKLGERELKNTGFKVKEVRE